MSVFSKKNTMFKRLLIKSFRERKSRVALAFAAIVVGVSIASALIGMSYDLGRKMNRELRTYGANLAITPETDFREEGYLSAVTTIGEGRYIGEQELKKLRELPSSANILGLASYLYAVVRVGTQPVVLAGVVFSETRKVNPFWEVEGEEIDDEDRTNSLLGQAAAEKLKLKTGDSFVLEYGEGTGRATRSFRVKGIVTTGSSEDNQIFVSLPAAQDLTGRRGKVTLITASVLGGLPAVEKLAEEIKRNIPNLTAKPIRRIAQAEGRILNKIKLTMFLLTTVILAISILCVITTMVSLVEERRKEIALFKALGARDGEIIRLFLSEALLIGTAGGLVSYGLGLLLAQIMSRNVFASSISPRMIVIPITLAIAWLVSLLGSLLPLRLALKIEPATVLKEE